jgi:hypothetical protein
MEDAKTIVKSTIDERNLKLKQNFIFKFRETIDVKETDIIWQARRNAYFASFKLRDDIKPKLLVTGKFFFLNFFFKFNFFFFFFLI